MPQVWGPRAWLWGTPKACSPSVPPQTLLVEFYKGAPDLVKFQELWSQDQTYLDKLKVRGAGWGGGFGGAPAPCAGINWGSPPGLPGLPHPQRPELHPRPGADLQPPQAQRVRAQGPSTRTRCLPQPGRGSAAPGLTRTRRGAAPGAPEGAATPPAPPCPEGGRAGGGVSGSVVCGSGSLIKEQFLTGGSAGWGHAGLRTSCHGLD